MKTFKHPKRDVVSCDKVEICRRIYSNVHETCEGLRVKVHFDLCDAYDCPCEVDPVDHRRMRVAEKYENI